MGTLLTISTILAALGVGLLISRIPALSALTKRRAFGAGRTALLGAMVAAMGFRIGRTDEVIRGAGTVGLASIVFAAATMAGTLLVLTGIFSLRRLNGGGASEKPGPGSGGLREALADPLLLLGLLAAGFLAGWLTPFFPGSTGAGLVTGLLYALLVVVGLGLGGGELPWFHARARLDLLLIPLGTAAGSLTGGLAAGLALGLRPGPSLSVAAGFGWYSLSGVILTRMDSPGLGAIAFLSNMLRESAALVLVPLLARSRFPLLAVGAGGATSMDVCLAVTYRNVGEWSIPYCLVSGGILSFLVPLLVPLFHAL